MRLSAPAAVFSKAATCFTLVAVLFLAAAPLRAAQVSGSFNVTVNLQSSNSSASQSAFCTSTPGGAAFGATVTVVCSTGAVVDIAPSRSGQPWSPMHGGAYRFLFQAKRGSEVLGTIEAYTGVGTSASWRVVNIANMEYLEMTTAW